MPQRIGLILGVSGQDGAYLSHLLLARHYAVHGVTRDKSTANLGNLQKLGVYEKIKIHNADTSSLASTIQLIEHVMPDEIYDLSGQSSVGLSFAQPLETFQSIAVRAVNILECLRTLRSPARLFHASSSECFGETVTAATETTAFRPNSPYAMAKAAAFWANSTYRYSYGMYVSSGILANHESPLRPERFVTRKIIKAAVDIGQGNPRRLTLGFLGIRRDWGWAPEYVDAMWRTLQKDEPGDYIIATGQTRSLEQLVETAFAQFGLDWRNHVDIDATLFRPTEIINAEFDPSRTRRSLNWIPGSDMGVVVKNLIECELRGGVGPLPWLHESDNISQNIFD